MLRMRVPVKSTLQWTSTGARGAYRTSQRMCSAKHGLWEILQNNKHAQSTNNLQEKKGKQSRTLRQGLLLGSWFKQLFSNLNQGCQFSYVWLQFFLRQADYLYKQSHLINHDLRCFSLVQIMPQWRNGVHLSAHTKRCRCFLQNKLCPFAIPKFLCWNHNFQCDCWLYFNVTALETGSLQR